MSSSRIVSHKSNDVYPYRWCQLFVCPFFPLPCFFVFLFKLYFRRWCGTFGYVNINLSYAKFSGMPLVFNFLSFTLLDFSNFLPFSIRLLACDFKGAKHDGIMMLNRNIHAPFTWTHAMIWCSYVPIHTHCFSSFSPSSSFVIVCRRRALT